MLHWPMHVWMFFAVGISHVFMAVAHLVTGSLAEALWEVPSAVALFCVVNIELFNERRIKERRARRRAPQERDPVEGVAGAEQGQGESP